MKGRIKQLLKGMLGPGAQWLRRKWRIRQVSQGEIIRIISCHSVSKRNKGHSSYSYYQDLKKMEHSTPNNNIYIHQRRHLTCTLLPCYFPFNWTHNAKVNQPTKINWLLSDFVAGSSFAARSLARSFIHSEIDWTVIADIMVVYVGELVPPTVSVTD